jgi:serine/threonine protein kinase
VNSQPQQARDATSTGSEPNTKTIIGGESITEGGTSKLTVQIGGQIGKYLIRSQLGEGGMGAVYLAFDPLIEREVAIKVLTQDVDASSAALQRFLQEARSIGRLNHPNVVSIFDIDQWNGQYYLVMELLSGGSLAELIEKRGALPWQEACQMIAQAASGLAAAHAAGMVHRDIKPENLMQTKEGHVKVVDFGLSKLVDATNDTRNAVTKQGQILGTPQYMSPEQFEAVEIDFRTDIYSLGASLFRLLTARFPYQDCATIVQTMLAHMNKPAPQASAYTAELPHECDRIIAKAMSKRPADRYQNAFEMADDLIDLIRSHRSRSEQSPATTATQAFSRGTAQQASPVSNRSRSVMESLVPLKSVVIVEPSKMLAAMLKDAVTRAGATNIRLVNSKEQALQTIATDVPDLFITSMQLPDGVGIDLLSELGLSAASSRTCLVLNSNDSTFAELVEVQGAVSRILAPKKVRPDDLLRVVHATGPCTLTQGSIAAPLDPLGVRLVVMTDVGKLSANLAELIREIGLLDVTVLGAAQTGSIPDDDFPTVVLHIRQANEAVGDDLVYAEKPMWLGNSRHLLGEVQSDNGRLLLRAVHRLGVTATTFRLLNVNTLECLLQSCRST